MKIICIGRNYREHAEELHNETPSEPVIFLKPDTSVLKGSDFYIPEFSNEVHYELEVIVKISASGKYIQEEFAHKHYEQIGLGIDFTARDLQNKLKIKALPWEIAKAFDGSAVVGKFRPKTDFNTDSIAFDLKKNKETVQSGNSKDMIFGIDKIIAYASKFFTLKIGDIIFTGTPKGVGKISENDLLEAFLDGEKNFEVRVK